MSFFNIVIVLSPCINSSKVYCKFKIDAITHAVDTVLIVAKCIVNSKK